MKVLLALSGKFFFPLQQNHIRTTKDLLKMQITENFRDSILFAMPELKQTDAERIAETEGCSPATVYNHWKTLKNCTGKITPIHWKISSLAKSYKKKAERDHKRMLKIQQQLSAA